MHCAVRPRVRQTIRSGDQPVGLHDRLPLRRHSGRISLRQVSSATTTTTQDDDSRRRRRRRVSARCSYGRKPTYVIMAALCGIASLILPLSPNVWVFIGVRLTLAVLNSASMVTGFVLGHLPYLPVTLCFQYIVKPSMFRSAEWPNIRQSSSSRKRTYRRGGSL